MACPTMAVGSLTIGTTQGAHLILTRFASCSIAAISTMHARLSGFGLVTGTRRSLNRLVEPPQAACCYLSIEAGCRRAAPGRLDSLMAGLSFGEVSELAWRVLKPGAMAALQVEDVAAEGATDPDSYRRIVGERKGE